MSREIDIHIMHQRAACHTSSIISIAHTPVILPVVYFPSPYAAAAVAVVADVVHGSSVATVVTCCSPLVLLWMSCWVMCDACLES